MWEVAGPLPLTMKILKNCVKTAICMAVCGSFVSGAIALDLGRITVEPGVTGKPPALDIQTTAGEEWKAFIYKVELGQTTLMSSETLQQTSDTVHVALPKVETDTYVEIGVTTHSELQAEDFRWRTLARADGRNLMNYRGRKELLPPPDFDEYWDRARKQLDSVPAEAKVTRVPDKDTSTGLLYRVELNSVENTAIVGWFYVPKEAYQDGITTAGVVKKYPAIIITPGYGAEEPPIDRTKDGYVTFSTNPRNHGPSKAFWKSPVEHLVYNITEPEHYYYKLAALDCLQAARFVLGREEVDAEHVGTEGGSQGGYLAVATAVLEPRIKCAVANVMAFTDYPDGMQLAAKGGQTEMRNLLAEKTTSTALVEKSLRYTDGANLITRLKSPVQISMGGVDPVCPYICGIVAYNRVPKGVEKEFHVYPSAAHEVPNAMRQWNKEWFARWLKPKDSAEGKH